MPEFRLALENVQASKKGFAHDVRARGGDAKAAADVLDQRFRSHRHAQAHPDRELREFAVDLRPSSHTAILVRRRKKLNRFFLHAPLEARALPC